MKTGQGDETGIVVQADGLIVQSVRACEGNSVVVGSNPVQVNFI